MVSAPFLNITVVLFPRLTRASTRAFDTNFLEDEAALKPRTVIFIGTSARTGDPTYMDKTELVTSKMVCQPWTSSQVLSGNLRTSVLNAKHCDMFRQCACPMQLRWSGANAIFSTKYWQLATQTWVDGFEASPNVPSHPFDLSGWPNRQHIPLPQKEGHRPWLLLQLDKQSLPSLSTPPLGCCILMPGIGMSIQSPILKARSLVNSTAIKG